MSRRRRDDEGAAALEFALVLPVFLMIAVGIIVFGIGYHQQLVVTRSAREAARTMAVTDSSSAATAAAYNAAGGIDTSTMTIVVTGCGPTPDLDDVATAEVSVPYEYTIPIVGTRNVILSSRAVMHCGG